MGKRNAWDVSRYGQGPAEKVKKKKKNLPSVELGVKCHMFLFRFLCLQLLREWHQELSHPHCRL